MLPRCLKDRDAEPGQRRRRRSQSRELPVSCNSCWQRSGVMLFISAMRVGRLEHLGLELLHAGRAGEAPAAGPTVMCRSLAPCFTQRREQFVDENRSHANLFQSLRGRCGALDEPFRRGLFPQAICGQAWTSGTRRVFRVSVQTLLARRPKTRVRPCKHYEGRPPQTQAFPKHYAT